MLTTIYILASSNLNWLIFSLYALLNNNDNDVQTVSAG